MKPLGSVAVSTTAAATPVPVARTRTQALARRDVPPAPQSAPATSGGVSLTWQGTSQAKPGETISLTLNAQSAQALGRAGLLVSFDPEVLKVVDVAEGGFFRQNEKQSSFSKTIDQDSGQILVDVSATGSDGASGTASFVTFMFKVSATPSESQIAVGRLSPIGPGGEELAVTLPEPHVIKVAP
jgi:general secretion pathway protein D